MQADARSSSLVLLVFLLLHIPAVLTVGVPDSRLRLPDLTDVQCAELVEPGRGVTTPDPRGRPSDASSETRELCTTTELKGSTLVVEAFKLSYRVINYKMIVSRG